MEEEQATDISNEIKRQYLMDGNTNKRNLSNDSNIETPKNKNIKESVIIGTSSGSSGDESDAETKQKTKALDTTE